MKGGKTGSFRVTFHDIISMMNLKHRFLGAFYFLTEGWCYGCKIDG